MTMVICKQLAARAWEDGFTKHVRYAFENPDHIHKTFVWDSIITPSLIFQQMKIYPWN